MSSDLHELFYRFPKNFPLPMVLDGSTGTSLMREGMPAGSCTEKWVLEHPDILRGIQRAYLEAGSDALYTPTFGGNRPTLERSGLDGPASVNAALAALTVGTSALAGGDLSPTGLFIEPFGDTPFDDVVEIYREQAQALDKAGVDFFIVETNISLCEARAAVLGVKAASDKPVFVTMTVDDEGRTLCGESLYSCLLSLAELGIAAFGTNCSQGPDGMLNILKELVPAALSLGIPLIAKPNAGLPHEEPDGSRRFDLDAKTFAAYLPDFLCAGIPILGGCCGTDAGFVRLIRQTVDEMKPTLDYSQITPVSTLNVAASTRVSAEVDPQELGEPIPADKNFFEAASEAADAGAAYLYVSLPDEAAADLFIENAPMLTVPFVVTGSPEAAAKAARYYNGKLQIL